MTAYSDTEKAVKAIKAGATDFVSKPWETEKLLATLSSAIKLSHSRKEVDRLQAQMNALKGEPDLPELIGESPAMQKVKDTITRLSETDANILISGENGTGKDLVARLLKYYSPRRDDAFITIDLGSIPEQLFESELFGYEKERLPMPVSRNPDGWKRLPAVRCFSMKSVICRCQCKPNY